MKAPLLEAVIQTSILDSQFSSWLERESPNESDLLITEVVTTLDSECNRIFNNFMKWWMNYSAKIEQ